MSKHADFFNGINLYGQDIINFKPHQVSALPASPFLGQLVFLDTVDGAHPANQTYQWDGTEWLTITHHDLTIAAGSADYLEINGHELGIKQLALSKPTVDNTYTTLAAWVTGTGYDGSQLQEGDVLILQAATAGQKTYIHKAGGTGIAADFVPMFDELTAAEVRGYFTDGEATTYNSADGSFDVGHDHNTININGSNELYVVDAGITAAKLATDSVTTVKIAADAVTAAKINSDVAGAAIVQNGTTGALDVNVDASTIEIDTDTLRVKNLGITEAKLATAVATKLNDSYAVTIGNGSDSLFTVTHSLGTRYVIVGVANISDDYKEVYPEVKKPTDNTVTIDFGAEVPASGQYAITIKKAV